MKIKALLFLCLLALSCGAPRSSQKQTEIDLMGRFILSDRSADSQFIFFGTPDSQRFLLTGWSDRQKTQGVPYLYATASKAGFIFNSTRVHPLYLHLKIKSKTPNPTTVFVNGQKITDLTIDNSTENYTVAIPVGAVRLQTNVVELQFSALSPIRKDNSEPVAAAAFYAAISPAKYIEKTPPEPMPEFWKREPLKLNYKWVNALQCARGGSFFDSEPLNKNALLKFGVYNKPSQFAENDDFATYSVLLRRDGGPQKTIYTKRLTEDATLNESLPLAPFVDQPGLYQIEFRLERNSMFDDRVSAWLEPTLLIDPPQMADWSAQSAEIEALRQINAGANVVIMLLDAGGAKHFSSYSYSRPTTPVFDALAKEGTRFEQAYCQAVYTLTSTASLMSGLLPVHHHVIYTRNRLSSDIFTLAESFESSGYNTGTFVANG
ncbi:MAG TPA: sulfatase-like hydrolase/transferase, partial [Acidobacteriota bacterium]|nr:sulfatase-like hydrolase/transferase [Acidobacteriota bacterium]